MVDISMKLQNSILPVLIDIVWASKPAQYICGENYNLDMHDLWDNTH